MSPRSQASWFFIDEQGEQQGPASTQDLAALCAQGTLSEETAVWSKALGEWKRLSNVPVLLAALG